MNVIIRRIPRTRFCRDDATVLLDIGGVLKLTHQAEIQESLWMHMCQFQATTNWAATRRGNIADGTPKHLDVPLNYPAWLFMGMARGGGNLVLWREGNRQLCSFKLGNVLIGNFHWRIDGEPVGKIPREPRKKHPKPVVL